MSTQQYPPQPSTIYSPYKTTHYHESDEEFINRQFHMCIEALERVHALSPGEFDRLVQTTVHTDEERQQRCAHHEDIARRALIAAQQHLLSEEEFNIWSGRRKEDGQPVKYRFERAFANLKSPLIVCKRGALTGIVRAYVRLQDDIITDLITKGEAAQSAEELLAVERLAIAAGFLVFERYSSGNVSGWPCFPRSTGRFRGATRLRQLFEQRQSTLPLPTDVAERLMMELTTTYPQPGAHSSATREPQEHYRIPEPSSSLFQRLRTRLSDLFR